MNQETATPGAQCETRIRNFSVQLSPTPRGARLARLLATEQLRSWSLPLDPAAHIVAELASNAVTHSRIPGRDFRLTLYVVATTLRIEVTDTRGDCLPQLQHPAPDVESGRGLVLVDALADRWGTAPGPYPRKTVWAQLEVGPPPELEFPCFGARGALHQGPRG
ncbi:ATP-binding protein [Streptomyces sp. NBC_00882]|uniref:ATP-binding protein n=1 Tax=Streptomyces sp. NBC_00882 TaxID=2975856 RepID=UPI003866AB82|nr:ATP-binding protein [Streptomyces sp. NBC_00882]